MFKIASWKSDRSLSSRRMQRSARAAVDERSEVDSERVHCCPQLQLFLSRTKKRRSGNSWWSSSLNALFSVFWGGSLRVRSARCWFFLRKTYDVTDLYHHKGPSALACKHDICLCIFGLWSFRPAVATAARGVVNVWREHNILRASRWKLSFFNGIGELIMWATSKSPRVSKN